MIFLKICYEPKCKYITIKNSPTLYNCPGHFGSLHYNEISPIAASPSVGFVSVHFAMPQLLSQPVAATQNISTTCLENLQKKHATLKSIINTNLQLLITFKKETIHKSLK